MRKVVLFGLALVVLGVAYSGWNAYEDRESPRRAGVEKTILEAQKAAVKARERAEHWSEHGNIRFREIACKSHPPDSPPRVAVSAWNEDVLAIKAPICINCAQHVESVEARVDGDSLWLTIKSTKIGDFAAACDCERIADIRIGSLTKRNYKIEGVAPVGLCI